MYFPTLWLNRQMFKCQNGIGAIDCTHIATRASSENEFDFKTFSLHKHESDVKTYLSNAMAKWPSSTHDSSILLSIGNRL